MTLRAGHLRHRVKFQAMIVTKDSSTGVVTTAWANFASVWCSIDPLSAREFQQADKTQSQIVARVTIRYRSKILPSMQIVHGDDIYKIEGILADRKSGVEYLTFPVSRVIRG